jgi:hypothetical protein
MTDTATTTADPFTDVLETVFGGPQQVDDVDAHIAHYWKPGSGISVWAVQHGT